MNRGEKERSYLLSAEEKKNLADALRTVLSGREEVLFAYLYGSVLGDLAVHDIDVGVYVTGVAEGAATVYAIDLSSVLQSVSSIPVDVRVINCAPLPFQYKALRGELLFERDDDARVSFTEQVTRGYLDIEPLLLRSFKEAFAA